MRKLVHTHGSTKMIVLGCVNFPTRSGDLKLPRQTFSLSPAVCKFRYKYNSHNLIRKRDLGGDAGAVVPLSFNASSSTGQKIILAVLLWSLFFHFSLLKTSVNRNSIPNLNVAVINYLVLFTFELETY